MQKQFKFDLKIYYEDTDAGGVVFYANYLKYLERARTEAIYSLGYTNTKLKEAVLVYDYDATPSTSSFENTLKYTLN